MWGAGVLRPYKETCAAFCTVVHWYQLGGRMTEDRNFVVERVQTGVRMEKRLLKVLKALAEYHDLTLGDLLEGIVLHAFDGKCPFEAASLKRIRDLKKFYDLDLDSSASHRLSEVGSGAHIDRKEKHTK
jgi:hypothetical protein